MYRNSFAAGILQTTYTIIYSENQSTVGKRSCKSCVSKETAAWSNVTTAPNYDNFSFVSSTIKTTVRRSRYTLPFAFTIVFKLNEIISYLIPPLSLAFNLMSIAIFYRMRYKIQSELVLLFIALSVVDTFAVVFDWRNMLYRTLPTTDLTRYNVGCQVMHWIASSCQVSSSCLVLLYTFERFISVRYPLKRAVICSGRRVRNAVLCIFMFAFTSQIYHLILNKVKNTSCAVPVGNQRLIYGYLKLYNLFVIGTLLPYCCIAFLNAMIVYHMMKYRRQRSALQASKMSSEEKTQRSMTIMLFAASTYSLVMMTPLMISRATDISQLGANVDLYLFRYVALRIISPWNYCGNFIFYVIGGRQFRKELFDMLRCRQVTGKQNATDTVQYIMHGSMPNIGWPVGQNVVHI